MDLNLPQFRDYSPSFALDDQFQDSNLVFVSGLLIVILDFCLLFVYTDSLS